MTTNNGDKRIIKLFVLYLAIIITVLGLGLSVGNALAAGFNATESEKLITRIQEEDTYMETLTISSVLSLLIILI